MSHGSGPSDSPPRLWVSERLARITGTVDERLAEALSAIPGVPLEVRGVSWALRLGPDRARSLKLVAESLDLDAARGAISTLDEIAREGADGEPVIELVGRPPDARLSLLEEWGYLWTLELHAVPGGIAREESGRYEVPLAEWTAQAIDAVVRTHGVRLSPGADIALREALGESAPRSFPSQAPDEPGFDITMPVGGHVLLAADPAGPVAARIAAVPGVRALGRGAGRWTVVPTPEAARAIRELTDAVPELTLDDASERWMREAPRWIAHVSVDSSGREPRIVIATRWGALPAALDRDLEGAVEHGSRHLVPLTPANLEALRRASASETDLSWTPSAEGSLAWLTDNPEAKAVPGAELDVVLGPDGPRYTVEAVWDEAAEAAFAQREAALLSERRSRAETLGASEWPPDALMRLIRAHGLTLTDAARRLIEGVGAEDADAQRLLDMSRAEDAELEVPGLAGELMPFQRAGVVYALERRRVFLADEQGLGKTIQALATIQADHAYPAVVISPASLKLNWLREIEAWLPERNAIAISGRGEADLAGADFIVVNYEVVGDHLEALSELSPQALVMDESHYVKNPSARRTRAVLALALRLGPDALRLALTGTPVVNRPAELAPQLMALDRLGEYGSIETFRRGFARAGSRRRLHHRLRSSCYLRRRKEDVLDQLPAKRRAVVTVPIDNEREYRRAERDFIRWLAEQMADDRSGMVRPDRRAEALVKMTALRRLAAQGKLDAATTWIGDFCETEERLVVFAHHRVIQEKVIEQFPGCAQIVGWDSLEEREANVRRFQSEDGPALCVCSLEVASHGFTLTQAANVAFLELAWTPAKHDQAEDRTHRIGQERSVTAWYLLASETIDERIAALLAEKRDIVDSVTDGGEGGGGSLADSLMGEYAARA